MQRNQRMSNQAKQTKHAWTFAQNHLHRRRSRISSLQVSDTACRRRAKPGRASHCSTSLRQLEPGSLPFLAQGIAATCSSRFVFVFVELGLCVEWLLVTDTDVEWLCAPDTIPP